MQSLADLVSPLAADEFTQKYWNRDYTLQIGDPDRFLPLLSWQDLNHILEFSALHPPRIRLVEETRGVGEDSFMESGAAYSHLNVAGMTQALGRGATLVLDRVDRLHPPLLRLAQTLQRELQCGVGMNLYGTWRTQKGFDLHWDKHDVLVLQVSGRKHWKLYRPTRLHPLRKDSSPAPTPDPDTQPVWEGILEAGSVLYFPRGWWHVVQAIDEPSLHITVGLTPYTGVELLMHMVEGLREHTEVRQDLPHLGSEEERLTYRLRLAQLLTDAAKSDFLGAFEREKAADRIMSDVQVDLPLSPVVQSKSITPETLLRLTRNAPLPLLRAAAGLWHLRAGGKDWPCEEDLIPILKRISYVASVRFSDLQALATNPLSQLKLRMILQILQTQGFLLLEQQDGPLH